MDKHTLSWLKGRDLLAALGALAVPTVATIFATDVAGWPWWPKWLLLILFAVAATVLVVDGLRRDRSIEQNIERTADVLVQQRRRQRNVAMDMAFRRMFNVGKIELRRKYDWTVFVFDDAQQLLVPVWPIPDPADAELFTVKAFEPGKGATGQAWRNKQTIVRTGAEVHNDAHGLSIEQQRYYAGRNTVVATPIFDDDDDLIGVLAGITDDVDTTYEQPNERHTLEATASVVGTLLATLWDALHESA